MTNAFCDTLLVGWRFLRIIQQISNSKEIEVKSARASELTNE